MDDAIGPFSIERVWNAADGQHTCRIAWTTARLAVRVSHVDMLTALERLLLDGLTPTDRWLIGLARR